MDKVEKLKNIWVHHPRPIAQQEDLLQEDLIIRYLDVFHFGDYYYVIFNTRTAEMEYISPKVESILGWPAADYNIKMVLDHIHMDDLAYYYHYEEAAVIFLSALSEDLLSKYKFSYDYRLKTKDGTYKRLQQQIIPIYYFPEGGVRTLAIFTDLTPMHISGIPKLSFIGMQGAPS